MVRLIIGMIIGYVISDIITSKYPQAATWKIQPTGGYLPSTYPPYPYQPKGAPTGSSIVTSVAPLFQRLGQGGGELMR